MQKRYVVTKLVNGLERARSTAETFESAAAFVEKEIEAELSARRFRPGAPAQAWAYASVGGEGDLVSWEVRAERESDAGARAEGAPGARKGGADV